MDKSVDTLYAKRMEDIQYYRSVDYSGFFERLFARGVDLILEAVIVYLTYKKIGILNALAIAVGFDILSRILLTYFFGATVGKFLFGVRVISRCGGKLSIWQVIIRELFKVISFLSLNFGFLSIIFSRRKRGWHDIIACTAVTSGGRSEAKYGREVYKERPEKWNLYIAGAVTIVLVLGAAIGVNRGACYALVHNGLFGFSRIMVSNPYEYVYRKASSATGLAAVNKDIVQVGDANGDGGNEVYVEGINENKVVLKYLRLIGLRPVLGDTAVILDKPIIQYRLLDMDGDKKDELLVLYEDGTLKALKFDESFTEIGSTGKVEYAKIDAMIKGKPGEGIPYRLYILGDKNKISVFSMKDGKLENQKLELSGNYSFISIEMGVFSGKNYIAGLTDDDRVVLYNYDGSSYKKVREIHLPVKKVSNIKIKDINMDNVNELVLFSQGKPSISAYALTDKELKCVWDGGDGYRMDGQSQVLSLEDGLDIDKDKKFEAIMSSKEASAQGGSASLFVFESNDYFMKANKIIRAISLRK